MNPKHINRKNKHMDKEHTLDTIFLKYLDGKGEEHFSPLCDIVEFGPPEDDYAPYVLAGPELYEWDGETFEEFQTLAQMILV
jgi:hypothetical protein